MLLLSVCGFNAAVIMPNTHGLMKIDVADVASVFLQFVKSITRVLPLVGVVLTTLLCASPVGQVSEVLK